MKDWAMPVVIAVVGGASAVLLAPQPGVPDPDALPYTVVFPEGPAGHCSVPAAATSLHDCATGGARDGAAPRHVLVVAQPSNVTHVQAAVHDAAGEGPFSLPTDIRWHGSVGLSPILHRPACDCPDAHAVGPAVARPPRAGAVTADATVHATVYAFLEDGRLAASNAPAAEQARFTRADGYAALDTDPWSLGPGTPPPGAAAVPRAVPAAIVDAAIGLPVGGIATVVVDDHRYASLVGPLYVTLRIDAVQPASG